MLDFPSHGAFGPIAAIGSGRHVWGGCKPAGGQHTLTALVIGGCLGTVGTIGDHCMQDGRIAVAGSASGDAETLALISTIKPDALLIDVDSCGADALTLTARLRSLVRAPSVVYFAATDALAARAFDLAVTDYVLKPLSQRRVAQAIDRVSESARQRREAGIGCADMLWLPRGRNLMRVPIDEIDRVEADRDYVRIWSCGVSYLLRATMGSIEERLPADRFLRIHRSTIVAVGRIQGCRHVGNGAWAVLDDDGNRHSVGRRHLSSVRERLGVTDDGE